MCWARVCKGCCRVTQHAWGGNRWGTNVHSIERKNIKKKSICRCSINSVYAVKGVDVLFARSLVHGETVLHVGEAFLSRVLTVDMYCRHALKFRLVSVCADTRDRLFRLGIERGSNDGSVQPSRRGRRRRTGIRGRGRGWTATLGSRVRGESPVIVLRIILLLLLQESTLCTAGGVPAREGKEEHDLIASRDASPRPSKTCGSPKRCSRRGDG